ncbi:MAG: FAA hydrolase family protein [Rhodobacteraceae bacterium]|nr:MAG: FAA hydrolase family protein [Paracoccaceae bacterium]
MDYVIPPPPPPAVPVAEGGLFPVRRVFCIGRNYAEHAREMGHDPDREPPFYFLKPADALTASPTIPYPPSTGDLHPEVELVVALGRGGAAIAEADALGHVWGYGVGLDMTRRDLQAEAKRLGRPWAPGKAFDASAPIGPLAPAARIGHPAAGAITLEVNGETRQRGDLSEMIWPVPALIAALSAHCALAPGDLVFTGTPAGVGPVGRGDRLAGAVEGVGRVEVVVA